MITTGDDSGVTRLGGQAHPVRVFPGFYVAGALPFTVEDRTVGSVF